MTPIPEYNPAWYEAKVKREISTPTGPLVEGQTVYFTPSAAPGSTIVFDGGHLIRNLTDAEMESHLGVKMSARSRWKRARDPIDMDNRYMRAALGKNGA